MMAHNDAVMAIFYSRSTQAFSEVDGDGGRVGVENASTWSPCRLQRSQGLSTKRGWGVLYGFTTDGEERQLLRCWKWRTSEVGRLGH